nr:hypothetical protein [Bradyrhizobium sp. SZCCHNRI1009]
MICVLGHGSDVIVVIVLIVIMLVMVVLVMIELIMLVLAIMMLVMTVALMVMLVGVLVRSEDGAGCLGGGRVAGLRDFASGLLGGGVVGLRGDGIMRFFGMAVRFVGCALLSFARRVLVVGLDRALGEALRLGRVGVRLIVLRIGVVLRRLVVGLMPLGLGREARLGGLDDLALDAFAAAAAP